jgi:hypothetical protein
MIQTTEDNSQLHILEFESGSIEYIFVLYFSTFSQKSIIQLLKILYSSPDVYCVDSWIAFLEGNMSFFS